MESNNNKPPKDEQKATEAARFASTAAPVRSKSLSEVSASDQSDKSDSSESEEVDFAEKTLVEGVYFTCDLLADDIVLRKGALKKALREHLEGRMSQEPVAASVLMLHSLNRREKRTTAIEAIGEFINNIIAHPEDQMCRKIQAKADVISAKGGKEFLLAVGFEERQMLNQEGGMEGFLLISQERANQTEALIQAKQVLDEGGPVPLKLHRNPEVKLVPAKLSQSGVPKEFYDKSGGEFMYCVVQVVFPDKYALQGTFGTKEKFSMVREFVQSNLKVEGRPFVLKRTTGDVVSHDSDAQTVGELGLAPLALLRFEWDADVLLEWSTNNIQKSYLKPDLCQ